MRVIAPLGGIRAWCGLLPLLGTVVSSAVAGEDAYRVTIRSTIKSASGAVAPTPPPASVFRTFGVSFRECPLSRDAAGNVDRVFRIYDLADADATKSTVVGLGAPPRQVIVDRRRGEELAHGIEGPLRASDVDFIAAHTWIPSLRGFLPPEGNAQDTWQANRESAAELAGLSEIESGLLECSDLGVQTAQGREIRQIAITGIVVGPCADGRTRNRIDAALALFEKTREIQSLTATGIREILGDNGQPKEALSVEYELVLAPLSGDKEFDPAVLSTLPTEPTEEMLALQWSDPELMLSFVFPRSWQARRTGERDVQLSQGASSVVLHPELEGKTPATRDYADEVVRYLTANRLPFTLVRQPQEVVSNAGRLGHFQFATTLERAPILLDYWVVSRGTRGATLAGRLEPDQASRLVNEIERIVRSVRFLSPRLDSQ